jgi:hypothetical protein
MTSLRRILVSALSGALLLGCGFGGAPRVDTIATQPGTIPATPTAGGPTSRPDVTPGVASPAPTAAAAVASISSFVRPFEYPTSIGDWNPTAVTMGRNLVTFSGDVLVAFAKAPWVDGCPRVDRTRVRSEPEGFVQDLEAVGRADITPAGEFMLDGHRALAFDQRVDRGCSTGHLHLAPPMKGLIVPGSWITLNKPARWIVGDVDGATILVRIGAASEAGLAEVLPARLEFLAGLHFLDAR